MTPPTECRHCHDYGIDEIGAACVECGKRESAALCSRCGDTGAYEVACPRYYVETVRCACVAVAT